MFFVELTILSSFISVNLLSCVSMNNQESKARLQVVNVNGDEPVFFPFSIKTSKCSGSCNNINHPCAKICVANAVEVFNLITRNNGTRHIEWHEACKCEFKFLANVIISNIVIKINADVNAKN